MPRPYLVNYTTVLLPLMGYHTRGTVDAALLAAAEGIRVLRSLVVVSPSDLFSEHRSRPRTRLVFLTCLGTSMGI